jgi:hypothetical protein
MTGEYLQTILKTAQAKLDKDGFLTLPEGTTLALYLAHDGVGLTINRVEAVRVDGNFLQARVGSGKRETFMLEQSDVFAAALEGGPGAPAKRAGFG